MNLSAPFIARPVMTTLIMVSILVFGVMAYRRLPVSDLPNVDFPTIQVTASLPGASPETMASSVATPLERQFTTIAGLDSMTSTSAVGTTQITLQFNLSRDIDAAAQDVQTALSRAGRQLPQDMPTPPSYNKVNPADQPVLFLALTSATLPMSEVNEFGETMIAQRISTVSGVAQVSVYGAQKYAVRVQFDPRQLTSRGIGIDEAADAVASANSNLPTGVLYGPTRSVTLEATGQLVTAEAYRPLVVAYRNGAPVRLEDIGRVLDDVENNKTAAWYVDKKQDNRAVVLAVQKQPGTNTVAVTEGVKALIPSFRNLLPGGVELKLLFDRSLSIKESVSDVKFTLVLTIVLVVLVIFVFLRNLSATVIPSLAVPMSLIGTFAVMYLLGYSLNNLTLMALTLSVGFVVDDAIVMLENIVRHLEEGEEPLPAAYKGSAEVAFTIVSMTVSLAVVFLPILFMGGIVGRLFTEFAATIGIAILISGFVSLTLTPMLCAMFLRRRAHAGHARHEGKESRSALYVWSERIFDKTLDWYRRTLLWTIGHRWKTLAISFVLFLVTIWMFQTIPKGFLPTEDTGQLFGFTEGIQGISFQKLIENQKQVAEVIRQNPNVEAFFSSVGARGGISAANSGFVFMRLSPHGERDASAAEVIEQLRGPLSKIPGLKVFLQVPPSIRIGGNLTKSLYQFSLQDPDVKQLYQIAPQVEERLTKLPILQDVTSDLQIKNPQLTVHINRDKARELGITASQIENNLYYSYGSRQISTIYTPNNDYKVIAELHPEYQTGPSALEYLYIRSGSGNLVPLRSVATLEPSVGPLSVNHIGQLPSVTVSFNTKPGVSLGDAVETVLNAVKEILPPSTTTSFLGAAQAFQSSVGNLGILLIVSVFVIYVVLGILYESFIHPITILTALPFAGLGALLTLKLFGLDLNIYAFVGIVMLVGLVKKNGIMMIDVAIEHQRERGAPPEKAIVDACILRFRPIMMTTMAALLGTLPLALGLGAGGEARQPLGLAVVGGLLFSQSLTLYVTPVFYLVAEQFASVGRKRRRYRGEKPGLSGEYEQRV